MATKSILKNVDIKDKKLARTFVAALENSENKKSKDVVLSKNYKDVHGNNILKVLGIN